jgi:peptidoglycan/LPS O-acetylase OafA/YrhL
VKNDHRHVPALDGIRGLAALMVFFDHYSGGQTSSFLIVRLIAKGLYLGWTGVSLFFVLSGFLISGILWDSIGKNNWWKSFYLRRSLRIFPLYYFSLFLIFAVTIVSKGTHWRFATMLPWVVYLQNVPWTDGLGNQFPNALSLRHFWSLAVEEQFYLIWPFLLLLMRKDIVRARRMCSFVWLISFFYRVAVVCFGWEIGWAASFLLGRCGELAAGAWLALAVRDARMGKHVQRYSPLVLILSFLPIVAVILLGGSILVKSPWMITVGIGSVSIFFAALLGITLNYSGIAAFFSYPWLRWMGKISYGLMGIYLTQVPPRSCGFRSSGWSNL